MARLVREPRRSSCPGGLDPEAGRPAGHDRAASGQVDAVDDLGGRRGGPKWCWKTIEQGAATSVLLAGSPLVAGVTGRYFEDCQVAGPNQPGVRRGVAGYALDPEAATRLWQVSADMITNAFR